MRLGTFILHLLFQLAVAVSRVVQRGIIKWGAGIAQWLERRTRD